MIFDQLKNAHKYHCLNPHFEKAFNFIKSTDMANLPVGEYEVDGKNVVVLIQEYTTMEEPPWESHNYHIDIQYLISGVEKIGYCSIEKGKHATEYNAVSDYYLLENIEDADYATLKDDTIMILFPEDAHVPRAAYDKPMAVKKCVIKIIV